MDYQISDNQFGLWSWMKKRIVYVAIFILVVTTSIIVFVNLHSNKEIINNNSAIEYNYKDVVYNFWGHVLAIDGDTLSMEGSIPGGEVNSQGDFLSQTKKIKVLPETEIFKMEKIESEIVQTKINFSEINIGDVLGVKADNIDSEAKDAIATDIIVNIKNPMPSRPDLINKSIN